jgi:death-on-curing protein
MVSLIYLTIEQVISIHKNTILISGGGTEGHFDLGKLESVLHNIQNDEYYPLFEDKLTHLMFTVNKFHCFQDGNKRLSLALGNLFLLLNGYLLASSRFFIDMENISYHVAAGRIGKELLHEIVCSIITDTLDNEVLKLKILQAIQVKN